MYAENFYIALYDEKRQVINFPYFIDSVDQDIPDPNDWDPFGIGDARGVHGLRAAPRQARALSRLARCANVLASRARSMIVGAEAVEWIGVPLTADGQTIGVVAVQTYREDRPTPPDDRRAA